MLPRIAARNAELLPLLRPSLLTFGIFPRGTAAVSRGRFARNRVTRNLQSYRRERAMIGEHLGAYSWPSAEPSRPKRPAFASSSARRACPPTPGDSLPCRDRRIVALAPMSNIPKFGISIAIPRFNFSVVARYAFFFSLISALFLCRLSL